MWKTTYSGAPIGVLLRIDELAKSLQLFIAQHSDHLHGLQLGKREIAVIHKILKCDSKGVTNQLQGVHRMLDCIQQ